MGDQFSKKALVFSAVGFFLGGLIVGGLLTRAFFLPAAPTPAFLPIKTQLEEAHRLLDRGSLVDAEKSYQAVLASDPGNPEALTHLGNVAFQQGDIERALRFYDVALQQDASYAHALWDKGIALRAKGDDVGAIESWEIFARLFPADSADVATVRKWIAEAQARIASAAKSPEGAARRLFTDKPPKGILEGKYSK